MRLFFMGSLNLAAITATSPYIKKIQSALEKATGQTIVTPEFRKIKRVAGVSVLPVAFSFQVALRLHFIFVH